MGYYVLPGPATTIPATAAVDDWAYIDPPTYQPPPDNIHWAKSVTHTPPDRIDTGPERELLLILDGKLPIGPGGKPRQWWNVPPHLQWTPPEPPPPQQPPTRRRPKTHEQRQRDAKIRWATALIHTGHTNEEVATRLNVNVVLVRSLRAGLATSDPPSYTPKRTTTD